MVKKFLEKSRSLLFRRQSTILSAAMIMMSLVLASRFLGLWRNWFLARYFGAHGTLDAFNVAFVVPDLLANVLITGALSVAFIPIFMNLLHEGKDEESEILSSSVLNLALIIYAIVGAIVFVFPYQINSLIAPGLPAATAAQAAVLTRVIIFGEFFLVIGIFFTSLLQSYHRFLISALAPIVYNLGIIFGIVFLSRSMGILGVGIGVVIGALLHVLVQLVVLNWLGYHYRSILSLKNTSVQRVLKLSLPRAIGAGVGQLEWVVSVILASTLVSGSVAILKFSYDLQNVPIGVVGLSIATAALPTLSAEWNKDKYHDFKKTFLNSLFQLLYLAIPLSVILAVLRIPVVRLVLGSGLFDWSATVATAYTTSLFAIGVFAQAGFLLVTRAFYAMHDTTTPLKVAIAGLTFHALISAYFIFILAGQLSWQVSPVAYLGLATSLSGAFSFFILLFLLGKRLGGFKQEEIVMPFVKILVPALVMGLFLYIPLHLKIDHKFIIDYIIDTTRTLNLLVLTSLVALFGAVVYLAVSWWLGSEELYSFIKMLPDFRKIARLVDFEEPVDTTHSSPHS